MQQSRSHWTYFHESLCPLIFRTSVDKIPVSLNSTNNNRHFTCRPIYIYTVLIISGSVLLRMRNVADNSYREYQNTHFVFNNFFSENCPVYEIMWKNVQRGRLQMTTWRMHIACWVPNATDTHTICTTYCFSSTTTVARTRLSVTLSFIACIVVTETESVYCAVRTGPLYIIQVMCFVWFWEQTAIIFLHSINWLVFVTCSLRGMNWVYIMCVAFSLRKLNAGSSQLSDACRHKLLQHWLRVYVL